MTWLQDSIKKCQALWTQWRKIYVPALRSREDLEETLIAELDKVGIMAFEISVIESSHGKMEVYLGTSKGTEVGKIENVIESVVETPMGYECDSANGLMKFVSRAKFTADIAIRQISRDFSEVSGDSIDTFVTEDYKQYVILSDGMGSGKGQCLRVI